MHEARYEFYEKHISRNKYSDIVPNFLNDLYIIIIEYQRVKVIICGINL